MDWDFWRDQRSECGEMEECVRAGSSGDSARATTSPVCPGLARLWPHRAVGVLLVGTELWCTLVAVSGCGVTSRRFFWPGMSTGLAGTSGTVVLVAASSHGAPSC
jgi:hypothetical protein